MYKYLFTFAVGMFMGVALSLPAHADAATGAIDTFTKTGSGMDSDMCALNSVVSVLGGSGDATIQLTGTAPWTYVLVAPGTAYTTGSLYAVDITACGASADGEIQVDTVIEPEPPPLGGATSTVEQTQQNLAFAVLFFFISMHLMIWVMRKH